MALEESSILQRLNSQGQGREQTLAGEIRDLCTTIRRITQDLPTAGAEEKEKGQILKAGDSAGQIPTASDSADSTEPVQGRDEKEVGDEKERGDEKEERDERDRHVAEGTAAAVSHGAGGVMGELATSRLPEDRAPDRGMQGDDSTDPMAAPYPTEKIYEEDGRCISHFLHFDTKNDYFQINFQAR